MPHPRKIKQGAVGMLPLSTPPLACGSLRSHQTQLEYVSCLEAPLEKAAGANHARDTMQGTSSEGRWAVLQLSWGAQDVILTAMTAEPGAQRSTASAAAGCPITSLSTPASSRSSSFTSLSPQLAALSLPLALTRLPCLLSRARCYSYAPLNCMWARTA